MKHFVVIVLFEGAQMNVNVSYPDDAVDATNSVLTALGLTAEAWISTKEYAA